MSGTAGATFFLDDFALKCFVPQSAAGTYIDCDTANFLRLVHEHYDRVPPSTSLVATHSPCSLCHVLCAVVEARSYCPTCAAGD